MSIQFQQIEEHERHGTGCFSVSITLKIIHLRNHTKPSDVMFECYNGIIFSPAYLSNQ